MTLLSLQDRRDGPTPPHSVWMKKLNLSQRMAMIELEDYGWTVQFIRNANSFDQVVVMTDLGQTMFAVLALDGSLDGSVVRDVRDGPKLARTPPPNDL